MKYEKQNFISGLKRITNYTEGLTSLFAGSYVLSLAVTKGNIALRIALGIAGGYLILRSGSKLHSDSFDEEIL
jgi:ABC-type glycerol-3-phosphate transport system permease component